MPSNTGKYFSCFYCGAKLIALKPDDINTKPNKNRINLDDIKTLQKCKECDKNNRIYWSEQKRSK